METQTKPVPIIYTYTQHEPSIKAIESTCGVEMIRLKQDRTKDPVEDVLTQLPMPYMVMPYKPFDEKIEEWTKCGATTRVWLVEMKGETFAVVNKPPASEDYQYIALPEEVAQKVKERAPWIKMKVLELDSKPIAVIEGHVPIILYAVMPVDKAIELKQKAPWLRVRLMQLDGKVVEKLTGRPYDPKVEYPLEVVKQALRVFEIRGGSIRYLRCVDDLLCELNGKKVAVFNDVMREALRIVNKNKVSVELIKECGNDGNCIEINPLGPKPGYRISFAGTVGKLTAEQMAEMFMRGETRIYYAELNTVEVQPCQ
jgi:hypothetical protein